MYPEARGELGPIQEFRRRELHKYIAGKCDKKLLFERNKSLFANVALHLFWDCRATLALPNFVYKGIVLCAGGYYFYAITALHAMVSKGAGLSVQEERFGSDSQ
jgi:hypothetical protein